MRHYICLPLDNDLILNICRSHEEEMEPLVSPLTLSAAMKVDSSFVPSLVPMMQCGMSASLLQVRLANHVQCMGKGIYV